MDTKHAGDFKNEKEFQSYLLLNANLWVKDFFGESPKSIKEQVYLEEGKRFGFNKPRIDILLTLKNFKKIGIEVKNPTQNFAELSRSISQILSYIVLSEDNKLVINEFIIITSKIDPILYRVIRRFNLPIRIFLITKSIHCEIK